MEASLNVLKAAQTRFDLDLDLAMVEIGFAALEKHGSTIPQDLLEVSKKAHGIILGPVSHADYPPLDEGGINPSGYLRKHLDLFANIRPARSRKGLATPTGKRLDLVIVRENTEGFYADRTMYVGSGEIMPTPDLALAVRKVSSSASRRIADAAFDLAEQRRKRVTAVHKANVLRVSDGLFLKEVRGVAATRPGIDYDEMLVDAMAAHLIRDPEPYDVIVTTNMFGDILSDEASELSGGLGLAASLNAGGTYAMAQAQHGSAPSLAGKDIANPTSLIGSVALLLHWLSRRHKAPRMSEAATAMENALDTALANPETRTIDLSGALSTSQFGRLVARLISG
jgi:3-isopropylmalate dehydrogenase